MDTVEKHTLDKEIEIVLEQLKRCQPGTDDYKEVLKNLRDLYAIKKGDRISREAILSAVVNIAGILLVLNFEKLGVITSKAFGIIRRAV